MHLLIFLLQNPETAVISIHMHICNFVKSSNFYNSCAVSYFKLFLVHERWKNERWKILIIFGYTQSNFYY